MPSVRKSLSPETIWGTHCPVCDLDWPTIAHVRRCQGQHAAKKSLTSRVPAVQRSDLDGGCLPITAEVDLAGRPVNGWGQCEYIERGQVQLLGWGDIDGPATVWTHHGGSYSILIPA